MVSGDLEKLNLCFCFASDEQTGNKENRKGESQFKEEFKLFLVAFE